MKTVTLNDYKQRMLRVLVHIQESLDQPLCLDDLARLAHFSPFHFHRVFSGMIGESVQTHIRRLRLERAASRLATGGQPVTQIALDAGYETPEAFCRAFKGMFGLAPTRFRALRGPLRAADAAAAPSGVHFRERDRVRGFRALRPSAPPMNVTLQTLPARRVAFVRHLGPYATCGAAWDRLCTFLGKEGMLGGDSLFIGICHDDPAVTPPDRIRYDACVTVDDQFRPSGEIGVQTIAGGDYAVCTHEGPYDRLNETYARLMGQWLPRSGRELGAAPCFEVYLNDPNSTEPADLLTDVHVPLAPPSPLPSQRKNAP